MLVVKDAHRCLDHVPFGGDGADLDDRAAEVAGQLHQPALRLERIGRGAQDPVVLGLARTRGVGHAAVGQPRFQ